jgi:putative ABC transport system permease protein
MSDLKLALTYLRSRPLITVLTVASVALGLALATIVLMLSHQTQQMLSTETSRWDMVVGAKGSPLQLVLNSMYYLDQPTGNVNISVWQHLQTDASVETILPLNMGDSYLGWHIVGTVPAFFDGRHAVSGGSLLASGRLFAKPFEVVVGASVAAQQQLHLGQQIISSHGWMKSDDFHTQFPYTVVGILAPTGSNVDRAVYTDYHSAWIVHAHPDADEKVVPGHDPTHEVTALLVRLRMPARRFMLIQDINLHQPAMAASPVEEINNLAMLLIAPLQSVLLFVAYLVVVVSALSILISLYLTIFQRRRDIAILRSLGATQGDIFRLITLEAAMLSGVGVLVGWLLGHGLVVFAAPAISARFGFTLTGWLVQPVELTIVCSVWVLGICAGLLPAVMAYRLPVADTLVRE